MFSGRWGMLGGISKKIVIIKGSCNASFYHQTHYSRIFTNNLGVNLSTGAPCFGFAPVNDRSVNQFGNLWAIFRFAAILAGFNHCLTRER